MELRLRYAPEAVNAGRFAADIVVSAAQVSGVELDYSVGSLAVVDGIIEEFRESGIVGEQVGETLFGFGCYVGEVMVRQGGAAWRGVGGEEAVAFGFPLVVDLPSGQVGNPIGKVFRRLENGPQDSLPYFYTVFAEPWRRV
ncbi:hypothetical protein OU787_08490 [Kitasatospora sp. YST-16]|uniref:hypothetical protein n=1 Tax=Kitasatospora sp. YST-16 TaxID=2998080 RepID=UPI0022834F63|nr:hypothetical protein [Kitasatospora sp. YST-16]WAL71536.1 hypothetical protein OU787_08490 [Kitasatospora sp. YST-16]WNW37576.1 hypothetical protein RKE32_08435 [Streptomyces sp. Li-HN-5-13]